jgi:serine beta-lactamase-like protein LACTB
MPRPLVLLLVSCLATPVYSQAPPFRHADAVDTAAKTEIEKQSLVGTAVVVIDDGKIVWSKGYGFIDRENKIAADPASSHFRWASISKSVTAVAAMQLAEKGLLDLDTDIRKYVPEFPDKGVPITTRQLLCHQGGIVHYVNGKVIKTEKTYPIEHPFKDVVTALDTFKESPLVNPPGEKFSYSTHGYILLSAVVERAGKEPFTDQVKKRIAEPLGMKDFRPDYEWENIPNRAVGYQRVGTEFKRRPADKAPDVSWKLGGGGYTSTAIDLARFGAGLINRKLVSEKTEKEMWARQKLKDGKDAGPYCLGFTQGTTPGGVKWIGHSGAQEKTRTMMMIDPVSKRGVAVMTNSEWAVTTRVAAAVMDAMK